MNSPNFLQSICGMDARRRLMKESQTSKGGHTGVGLKLGWEVGGDSMMVRAGGGTQPGGWGGRQGH